MKNNPSKFIYAVMMFWHLIFLSGVAAIQRNTTVGVVLDLDSSVGKMGLSCINMALSQFYLSHSHYNTRILLSVRDSQRDIVTAAAKVVDLIKNEEVKAIIGPTTSMQANFVINLGEKAHVPIITFSATCPSLTSPPSPYSFRMAQNDSVQVHAISAIVQAFGWKAAVPIYINNEYGEGIIPFLTNALEQVNVRIPYLSVISSTATDDDIIKELYKLMTMQTRVFVVHLSSKLGSRIFTLAAKIEMMQKGYVWIVTNGMGNKLTSLSSSVKESMEGVLGVRTYIPRTKLLDEFQVRWRRKFLLEYPSLVDTNLDAFGVWAYDAAIALAMAVEKVGSRSDFGFHMRKGSSYFSDLESFGVSQLGESLSKALSSTKFKGLSGDISIVDGQLQAATFEIINVNGNGERRVGFWTSQNGLMKDLSSTKERAYSTSKNNLGPIIWPGDTSSVPKGWEIPTNEKKLTIGVPVKDGFTEFVKVKHDTVTNTTEVTGFSVDVFKAALEVMPYSLPYEFIPYAKPNGESAGTYNDLVRQVYYGKFDAVVGDITITANRSKYVDFTLPYTESGVSMIVPVRDNRQKNAWAFLKPLTLSLWMTTAFSFIFVGFVVWVLEHRINEKFRGPPSHQIGTSLWFSFSTMVFAHREKVVSNLARFVVIIWVFVVLILVQSYTASLTSLLTVEQLLPTLTDANQLIKNSLNVGYQKGSFVHDILKDMGFQDFQLKAYNSTEHCFELLAKGTAYDGIDAAFDEIPILRLLLATHCSSKYTIVQPTFKADGLGFAFPRDSPIVADVSRAILSVTQGENLRTIENAWFKRSSCLESDALVFSNSLGLESFWGLFLIAGVASVFALIIFAVTFAYQNRNIWWRYNPDASIWKRIGALIRIFDQKDLNCHTFKKSDVQDKTEISIDTGEVEASPGTNCICPPSPSSQTESDFSFSADYGDTNPYGGAPQDIEAIRPAGVAHPTNS